jgi:precorrin-8X/cobalt-precorrin-8 methylmutase
MPARFDYLKDPQAIYRASFAAIEAEADLAALPTDMQAVARRVIHACGMTDIVGDLRWSADAVAAGTAALVAGAPVICDTRMVAAGIMATRLPADNRLLTAIGQDTAADMAARYKTTKSAGGIAALAGRLGGAVLVIGNAPTALFRLLELAAEEDMRPALVLGFPVGFIGAAESKVALIDNTLDLPFIALKGRRGGSAMAAAAFNALIVAESVS